MRWGRRPPVEAVGQLESHDPSPSWQFHNLQVAKIQVGRRIMSLEADRPACQASLLSGIGSFCAIISEIRDLDAIDPHSYVTS